jgi:hypothetical protein
MFISFLETALRKRLVVERIHFYTWRRRAERIGAMAIVVEPIPFFFW